MIIESSDLVPPGKQLLWRNGLLIWAGDLGAPTEDADHDKVTVSPQDYERIKAQTIAHT